MENQKDFDSNIEIAFGRIEDFVGVERILVVILSPQFFQKVLSLQSLELEREICLWKNRKHCRT